MPSPFRTNAIALVLSSVLIAVAGCSKEPQAAKPRALERVGVVSVQAQRQVITIELAGRTSARLIAEIRPQVGGIVQRRLFEEGAQVKAGQVLYEIDPASFQASFASAKANVVKADAAVNSLATIARRNAQLVKIDAISEQTNDESRAALKQAQADAGIARAALETARIDLARTRITAPISGRVDTSTVTAGSAGHGQSRNGVNDRTATRSFICGHHAVERRTVASQARVSQWNPHPRRRK